MAIRFSIPFSSLFHTRSCPMLFRTIAFSIIRPTETCLLSICWSSISPPLQNPSTPHSMCPLLTMPYTITSRVPFLLLMTWMMLDSCSICCWEVRQLVRSETLMLISFIWDSFVLCYILKITATMECFITNNIWRTMKLTSSPFWRMSTKMFDCLVLYMNTYIRANVLLIMNTSFICLLIMLLLDCCDCAICILIWSTILHYMRKSMALPPKQSGILGRYLRWWIESHRRKILWRTSFSNSPNISISTPLWNWQSHTSWMSIPPVPTRLFAMILLLRYLLLKRNWLTRT